MFKSITGKTSNYLSLVKFSHTMFALPFALIGYFYAITSLDASFDYKLFLLVLLCMVFARNAAMGFNRFIDRSFDEKNPRTKDREIPANKIKPQAALWFVIINSALFITATYFINLLCFFLSPVALIVILGYSYTKRFTFICHLILGLGLSLSPIGAYLAVSGKFALVPVLFSLIVFFWVSGFDIIYAMQDIDFDKSLNLKSIPSVFGEKNSLLFSSILHVFTASLVLLIGYLITASWFYWGGAVIFIALLFYQHRLVKPNDLSKVNLAFATTNGIGSVVFAAFVIADFFFNK